MVVKVTITIPGLSPGDKTVVQEAERKLAQMTATETVERSSSTMRRYDDSSSESWNATVLTAYCEPSLFNEQTVRTVHQTLAESISVPAEVAIETRAVEGRESNVLAQDLHLVR